MAISQAGLDGGTVARYFTPVNDSSPARHNRFRAYRERKRAAGYRELRMWVPDLDSPEFREEAARQAALLDHSEEEREIAAFMVAAAAEARQSEE